MLVNGKKVQKALKKKTFLLYILRKGFYCRKQIDFLLDRELSLGFLTF